MSTDLVLIALFALAAGVALFTRRFKVPYTVALVVVGLVLGPTSGLHAPELTKHLLYAVFLPGLLFEAAFHMELKRLWENRWSVSALALPGVAGATCLTALFLFSFARWFDFGSEFEILHVLVFGALISATDPIAVVALFKSLGVPKRLAVLVEGESLINDATSVVALSLLLGLVAGETTTVPAAAIEFLRVLGVGIAIGGLIGFVVSQIIRFVDDPMIEITATTIAAYGSFAIAETVHASGVIATVAAGLICGSYGARVAMTASTRIAVTSFWEYVAFALNSIVFLLIGFQVHLDALIASWKEIAAAFVAVTLGRAIVVMLVTALMRKTRERFSWSWATVLTWGGLRGSLSMVLVLALPEGFAERQLLITMTFGVVILSIFVQGLSMPFLLKKLKVLIGGARQAEYENQRVELLAAAAALAELEHISAQRIVHTGVTDDFGRSYRERIARAEKALAEIEKNDGVAVVIAEERAEISMRLLHAERDRLHAAHHSGIISAQAYRAATARIDAELEKIPDAT